MRKASALRCFSLFGLCGLVFPMKGAADNMKEEIDIPYQRFVLDNGLTLIVHEDHKAPIVAVNVWYHVGSKNEKPGKTGFAHLFEHLMFNGSENYDDDYFKPFERAGATDMNGTTSRDRTNYFQNVPVSALDLALWMESDRMGRLIGAITQAKLDEQRGVVQNEKRQGENQPYGKVAETIVQNTYPAGHPYSWTVIGSMEDLNAASLDDVHEWFKTRYGAANAVLVVAGDIDVPTAKEKVEKHFGNIPSGPPAAKQELWIAERSGTHRQVMQDRVAQSRLYKVWNIPQWGSEDGDCLDLAADILSSGKSSRLMKRLVIDDQIATDVSAAASLGEIAGQFYIAATARPGVELERIEKAIEEELARFLDEGPTEKELQRVKVQFRANFVRGIERIGGFGGKSDVLAESEVFGGSPDSYKVALKRRAQATPAQIQNAARRWLSDGVYILEVHPFPDYRTSGSDVDRSKLPEPGTAPEPKFPDLQRTTLSNGLKVILAERHAIPVIDFELLVEAGYAADPPAAPGTASLAMAMLDEGTKSRTTLEISDELMMLGARLRAEANLDMLNVSLSSLKENLDSSLAIYADVILNPSFPETEFQRLQKQRLATIRQEKSRPAQAALRVLPQLLYGKGHPYGNPLTGTGTEEAVASLTPGDLARFHRTWLRPNNATLIVVGDAALEEIAPKLEGLFQGWEKADTPNMDIRSVEGPARSALYLIDKPGAPQSTIYAARLAPPTANPDEIAIEALNRILGGSFTSRINMNLREDKHWTYGARSSLHAARGQRPFCVSTSVQTDKTAESMQEIAKELSGIRAERPVTSEELAQAQDALTLRLPGAWETMDDVAGAIGRIVRFGLPGDYYAIYPQKVRELTLADMATAAERVIGSGSLVWVIVGDRDKIEPEIAESGFGEAQIIDADGQSKE